MTEETTEMRWTRHSEAGRRFFSQGDLVRAEAEFIAAVREAKAMGGDGLQLATSLGSLGQLRYRQREFAQAEKLFRHALALREQALGTADPGVVQSLNNLAALHYARGETSQAEPLFRRALTINEQELGDGHPELDVNLNNLAKLYVRVRDFASAEPLLQRLLALREQVKGSDDPATATVLVMLARARLALGATEEAESLCLRALSIHEAVLPTGHATLLATQKLYDEILAARSAVEQREAAAAPEPAPLVPPAREPEAVEPPLAEAPLPEPTPEVSYLPLAPAPLPSAPAVEPVMPATPPAPPITPLAPAPYGSLSPLPGRPQQDTPAVPPSAPAASRERVHQDPTQRPKFVPPPSWRPINAVVETHVDTPLPRDSRDDWALDPREVADVPATASEPVAETAPSVALTESDAARESHAAPAPPPPTPRHSPTGAHEVDDDETTALLEAELRARRRHRRPSRWRSTDISFRRVGLAAAGVMLVFASAYLVVGRGNDATAGVPPVDSVAPAPAPRPVLGDFDRRLPSPPPEDARTTRSDAAMAEPAGDTRSEEPDDFLLYEDSIAQLPRVRIQVDNVTRSIARTKARVDSLGREIPPEPIQFQRPPQRGP